MNKIIVLGTSAVFPLPRTVSNKFEDYTSPTYIQKFILHDDPVCSAAKKGGKDRRLRSSLAVSTNDGVLFIDAGPDVITQIQRFKLKPDVVCITHNHADATTGISKLVNVRVLREKDGLTAGKTINLVGIKVTPFRVQHAQNTETLGFKLEINKKRIVYISDLANLRGIYPYARAADIYFCDGSSLYKDIPGHRAIIKQLQIYKKWDIRRIIFTHIGHAVLPHKKLEGFVKQIDKRAEIAYDGMRIDFR